MKKPGRRQGLQMNDFEKWIRVHLEKSRASSAPLPTTRELANRYGVANSTVFRLFMKLEAEGLLWRAFNGRFFDARARALVDKPLPIACLFRRIEDWSLLYQELMEGIASACEQEGCASLLWHDDRLVQHGKVGSPPRFASIGTQEKSLETFLNRYQRSAGGFIFDHAWSDKVLAELPPEIKKMSVILCRTGPKDILSVAPDGVHAARLALAHLLDLGCINIHPVRPFFGDAAVEYLLEGINEAASLSHCKLSGEVSAETALSRRHLMAQIKKSGKPTGLIVPEDNVACLLQEECFANNLESIKIISIQGTRKACNIMHVRTDYAALGAQAVCCLRDRH